MSLIKTIEEQVFFGFTGRISVLENPSGKFLGRILLFEGLIVNSFYENTTGERSLYLILLDDIGSGKDLSFVVEPELVSNSEFLFQLELPELKKKASGYIENFRTAKELKPPGMLKLIINPDFIPKGNKINEVEFDTLTVISEYSRVSEIYEQSLYPDHEVTLALVNLRKKGAIKVLGKRE